MNSNFAKDAKAADVTVTGLDAEFDACHSIPKLMRLCQKTAQKSRKKQNVIYTVSKTPVTELIYWSTPSRVSNDIDKESYDEQRKAAAEAWTQCLFVNGQTLFVTDHLTFETLAMAVPPLKSKLKFLEAPPEIDNKLLN